MSKDDNPLVSVGMPVFNSEDKIRFAIDSILSQTFKNFELVISDNCSTDSTKIICLEYAKKDSRIKYIRQSENIGAALNFKFVLDRSISKYFMWAAADDIRTDDFIEENVKFLELNSEYVASTSPNFMDGQQDNSSNLVDFDISGDLQNRFNKFFENCWKSHGIFYSLIRRNVLCECKVIGQSFIAADWAIDLYMLSKGPINRSTRGLAIFGAKGISSSLNPYRAFRNQHIELILPFYRLSLYAIQISSELTSMNRLRLILTLIWLNFIAVFDQSRSLLYQFYCAYFRQVVRRSKRV